METKNKEALNQRLLEVCLADPVDYELAEELLKQGAEPMGAIDSESIDNKDRSVVTIIEKESGKPVWKFGVSISPEEIAKENP